MLCRLSLRNDHLKPISTHSAQAYKTVLRLKFSVFNKAFKQLRVHHRRVRRHARLRGHGQFIFCNLSWKHRLQPCALQRIDELFCIVQILQLIYLSVLCICHNSVKKHKNRRSKVCFLLPSSTAASLVRYRTPLFWRNSPFCFDEIFGKLWRQEMSAAAVPSAATAILTPKWPLLPAQPPSLMLITVIECLTVKVCFLFRECNYP